jgi:hypothetical protein
VCLSLQEEREAAYVDMDKATEEKDAGNTGELRGHTHACVQIARGSIMIHHSQSCCKARLLALEDALDGSPENPISCKQDSPTALGGCMQGGSMGAW